MMQSTGLLLFILVGILSLVPILAYEYPDCQNGPLASYPICNSSVSIDVRTENFLSLLNITEKMSRLYSSSPAIPRLGIPFMNWVNDALHGLTCCNNFQFVNGPGEWNSSTSFPSPINFAATFDDTLARLLGRFTGIEARAFTNNGRGGVDLWSPNINPFRDPRWGRGQEVPGEDPYQGARYAYNYVYGMQRGEDPRYYLAVADCKHFAAYDLENWNHTDRNHFDAMVSLQDLVEYYLPSFEGCIRQGQSASIMCSYNALNGIPTCANDWLLQTMAREQWGFGALADGWVTSDCDAVSDVYYAHKYTATPEEAAAASLIAGTDLDCGGFYGNFLYGALNQSLVTERDIDRSVRRLTQHLLRVGYFDDPSNQPYRQYGWEHVETPEAIEASYRAALLSITLLKNDNNRLPLQSSNINIALIGPLYNDTYFIQGNYRGKPSAVITIELGLKDVAGVTVTTYFGCPVTQNDTSGFEAAVAGAAAADVVVYIGGLTENVEREGMDRTSIAWPGVQGQLIEQIAKAAKKPIIVLAMGGGQIDMTDIKADPQVGAILWIGYPSQEGGRAVASILWGRFSPSGRLVTTQYPADYVNQVSLEDMALRPSSSPPSPGRTYKWYTGQAIYSYGYGLSYTSFSYTFSDTPPQKVYIADLMSKAKENPALAPADIPKLPFQSYSCNVTNTGNVVSDVSVLLFVKSGRAGDPIQALAGYDHVYLLAPGATRTVYFAIQLEQISTVDENGDRWLVPGQYTFFVGYAGHAETSHRFELVGEPALLYVLPKERLPQSFLRNYIGQI